MRVSKRWRFLKLVAPYRHDLTVCCECMFGWYWLSDACQAAGLTFVLAHALGIDLHARQMYVCVMDRQGKKLVKP